MKKAKLVLILAVVLLINSPAWANVFVNGGFEDGTFNGWTKGGGTWTESGGFVSINPTGDPGKSAIVSAGLDPFTNNNLNMVYNGSYAARANNFDDSFHFSTLTQTVNNWTDDNIYFAWAAVLEEPSNAHPELAAPNFHILLHDDTTGVDLYTQAFNVYNAGGTGITWNTGLTTFNGTWKYNDWEVVALDTSLVKGDNLTLTLEAYDCGWGGHGGYAYLDGFGATPPDPNVVPEPATLSMLGLGLLGFIFKKKSIA